MTNKENNYRVDTYINLLPPPPPHCTNIFVHCVIVCIDVYSMLRVYSQLIYTDDLNRQ